MFKNKKNGPTFVRFFIRKRAKKSLPTLTRLIKVDLFKIKIKQKQKTPHRFLFDGKKTSKQLVETLEMNTLLEQSN